jgi:replicative DNA helicase
LLALAARLGVTAEDFSSSICRSIYGAAVAVAGRGAPVELLGVCMELGGDAVQQEAWLREAGEAMDACVSTAFAAHYFRTLRETGAAREFMATLADAFEACDANPSRVWEACAVCGESLRRLKKVRDELAAAFPPPHPAKPSKEGETRA